MIRKFSLKNIKYYIITWTFFLPGLFSRVADYAVVQQLASYASYLLAFGAIFIYFVFNRMKFHCNRAYIALALISLPMAIATVDETGRISSIFIPLFFRLFAWMLWLDLLRERNCLYQMIHAMSNTFFIMIVINTIGEIILPNGFVSEMTVDGGYWQQWTSIYFLGNDNTFALQYMFFLGIIAIDDYFHNSKITMKTIVAAIICDVSVVIVWTGSGLVSCLGMSIVLVLAYFNCLEQKYLNYKVLVPVYIIIFVLIVWNQDTGFLSFVFSRLLNKDLTLSGRTLVWPEYISLIMNKPLLGHGIAVTEYIEYRGRMRSTHNQILQILLYGGFASLMGYVSLIWIALKKQYANRHESIGAITTWLVLIMLICFMVEQNVFYLGQYVLLYILYIGMDNIHSELAIK